MEPVETDGGLQIAATGSDDGEQAVIAALDQLFTGLRVGLPSLIVHCCGCGAQLGEGDQVSVYAYRTVETPRWHLARCQCIDCARGNIETPTLGATEVRVTARLVVRSDAGTQQHCLCLADPDVLSFALPATGTTP